MAAEGILDSSKVDSSMAGSHSMGIHSNRCSKRIRWSRILRRVY